MDKSDNNDQEQGNCEEEDEKESSVSSTKEHETPMKPLTMATPSSKSCNEKEDNNEGKEGMANDNDDDELFSLNVQVRCKERKLSVCPLDWARAPAGFSKSEG